LIFQSLKGTDQLEQEVSRFTVGMDVTSVVVDPKTKGMKSRPIYDDLVTTLQDGPGYFMVTLWLRRERLARFFQPSHNLAEDRQVCEINQAIL
jgi:hypothetical protein